MTDFELEKPGMSEVGFYEELSSEILQDDGFRNDLLSILRYRFQKWFPKLDGSIKPDQVKRLLETSCILAQSPNPNHSRLALELVTLLWESPLAQEYHGISGVTKLVCSRLGNPAAYRLLSNTIVSTRSLDVEVRVKELENTVKLFTEQLVLTDFQKEVVELLTNRTSISFSAPTSAGKSFIVTRFVAEQFSKHSENGFSSAIIVPTRALIRQNTRDYLQLFQAETVHLGEKIEIITTAGEESQPGDEKLKLFVLTQERLLAITSNWQQVPKFDLFVVDEAQKIDHGARGILLEEIVEETLERCKNAQVVFLSALSKNPEFFKDTFNNSEVTPKKTENSAVAQNIYTINLRGDRVFVNKVQDDSVVELIKGMEIQIRRSYEEKESEKTKKLGLLASAVELLGAGVSNIIYARSPQAAAEIASELAKYNLDASSSNNPRVQQAIRIIKQEIHPDYALVNCLGNGVGYHYGNMPDIARQLVEDLFRSGQIRYLVCTSTLLEGVNLPAKNIFIDDPKLGKKIMDDRAFWNLAGRAGRLNRDLSGNVFCVGTDEWKGKILQRGSYMLTSALQEALRENKLLEYLGYPYGKNEEQLDKIRQKKYDDLPGICCNLVVKFKLRGDVYLSDYLEHKIHDSERVKRLVALARTRAAEISLPHEVLIKNRSIDPRLQQLFFESLVEGEGVSLTELMPKSPTELEFYHYLALVFEIANKFFRSGPIRPQFKADAVLATQWIREKSIREIIDSNITYRRENGLEVDPNKVIAKTIENINTELRFNYLSYIQCIFDIMKYLLSQREGFDQSRFQAPEFRLPNYLELGMNRTGAILYHNIGFSRGTAIKLNSYVNADRCKTPTEIREYVRDAVKKGGTREDYILEFECKQLGFME